MFLTLSTESLSRRATMDGERIMLLTDASDTYFEIVDAVEHESYEGVFLRWVCRFFWLGNLLTCWSSFYMRPRRQPQGRAVTKIKRQNIME